MFGADAEVKRRVDELEIESVHGGSGTRRGCSSFHDVVVAAGVLAAGTLQSTDRTRRKPTSVEPVMG